MQAAPPFALSKDTPAPAPQPLEPSALEQQVEVKVKSALGTSTPCREPLDPPQLKSATKPPPLQTPKPALSKAPLGLPSNTAGGTSVLDVAARRAMMAGGDESAGSDEDDWDDDDDDE
jgi:hypothetical protein